MWLNGRASSCTTRAARCPPACRPAHPPSCPPHHGSLAGRAKDLPAGCSPPRAPVQCAASRAERAAAHVRPIARCAAERRCRHGCVRRLLGHAGGAARLFFCLAVCMFWAATHAVVGSRCCILAGAGRCRLRLPIQPPPPLRHAPAAAAAAASCRPCLPLAGCRPAAALARPLAAAQVKTKTLVSSLAAMGIEEGEKVRPGWAALGLGLAGEDGGGAGSSWAAGRRGVRP